MTLSKEQLRDEQSRQAEEFAKKKPIYTYAESVDQEKRLKAKLENRKKPVNVSQAGWVQYLEDLKAGVKQEVQPSDNLWDVPLDKFQVTYTEKGSVKKNRWFVHAYDADSAIEDFRHWWKKEHLHRAVVIGVVKISDAK